ncbi:hypothetical protein [Clostridium sp. 1xD42-85]|uniref:hypothetical protein n=1 Tax=Clostridium sp. 1xD42-85 TaxID=2320084 RepID=UPI0015FF7710|nr:hypothetical protein [Clostridium sp. 1xD42-85]
MTHDNMVALETSISSVSSRMFAIEASISVANQSIAVRELGRFTKKLNKNNCLPINPALRGNKDVPSVS